MKTFVLGGGCFWCLDAVYQKTRGVSSVVSGYTGGHDPNPDYYSVCNGTTGHAEVVAVTFDPLPEAVLQPAHGAPPLLLPLAQRCEVLLDGGADAVVVVPANRQLLSMPAAQFVDEVIVARFARRFWIRRCHCRLRVRVAGSSCQDSPNRAARHISVGSGTTWRRLLIGWARWMLM